MLTRTRQHDSLENTQQPQDSAGTGSDLSMHRARAAEATAAGTSAIQNALSTNAAKFLQQSEQHGGE